MRGREIAEGRRRRVVENLLRVPLVALLVLEQPDVEDMVRVAGEVRPLDMIDGPFHGPRRPILHGPRRFIPHDDERLLQHDRKAAVGRQRFFQLQNMLHVVGRGEPSAGRERRLFLHQLVGLKADADHRPRFGRIAQRPELEKLLARHPAIRPIGLGRLVVEHLVLGGVVAEHQPKMPWSFAACRRNTCKRSRGSRLSDRHGARRSRRSYRPLCWRRPIHRPGRRRSRSFAAPGPARPYNSRGPAPDRSPTH